MNYKVRKGLETDLKIKGMTAKYFYIYCGLGGALGVIAMASFMAMIRGGAFMNFVFTLIVLGFVFIITRFVLMNMSRSDKLRKYKNNKEVTIISNRDILKWK